MTRELTYENQDINEIIKGLNREMGNQPFKVLISEEGFKIQIPEDGEDPLDLFHEEVDALDEVIESYLQSIGIDGEIGFDILGQTIWVNIDGADAGFFLKNRGDLLNDLQYMLEVYLNRMFPDVKAYVKCDAEARRRSHIDSMLDLAKKKAAHALDSGEPQKLPPMNAYERRVIHLAFLPDETIATRSHGMGSLKQVIISPASSNKEVKTENEAASTEA